jgi:AcrR family transcriptional regulator
MVSQHASEENDARGQVIAAATRLFAAHGFDGTSLQSIADALGVTKAAVLHHFPSKEALRAAVVGEILGHWQEMFPQILLTATAAEDRFDAVFGELVRFFKSDPDRARLVMREAMDRPGEVKKLLRGPVRPWLQAVAGYIQSGQSSGRHHEDLDPEAYVLHILMMVVTAVGAADVASAAIDSSDARHRYDRELARIARASLFRPHTKKR